MPRRRTLTWAGLALLVVVGVGLGARFALGHGQNAAWKVHDAPFAVQFFRDGKLVAADETATPAGPGTGFAYTLVNGSQHGLTHVTSKSAIAGGTRYRVATDEPNRTATVDVTRSHGGVRVAWTLQPPSGVTTVYSALRSHADNEHFLGTGISHQNVDLAGQIVQLKVSYSCSRSIVTPFFVSSAGYGAYYDTTAVGHIEFRGTHDGMACLDSNKQHTLCPLVSAPDRVETCFKSESLAYDVFTGTPTQVLQRYRLAAGHMKVPPVAQFGAIKWRDRVSNAAGILDDVAQFRRLRIPLGAMLLDNPWESQGCWGALTFDKSSFPDPRSLIAAVHRAGAKFMVWVSPDATTSAACLATSGIPAKEIVPGPPQFGYGDIDLTNTQALAQYTSRIEALVQLGVDGFKGDRGDETDKEGVTFANGSGLVVHNAFPELFAHAVTSAAAHAGKPSPLTMFRAADAQTPVVGGNVWTGDQTPDFAGMQDAIRSLASLGASGFAIAGSDVGGYATLTGKQILTPEVFARWTQLGAISPIFEVGGADRAAQFWKLGDAAVGAARRSILLHYALFPYLYGLARESARDGSPILQPLGLRYPDDARAWRHDLELLVGPSLLAAPVTSEARSLSVYLPQGDWVDLYDGLVINGGRTVTRSAPLDEFPLYLQANTTIPFALRTPLWPRAWPLDALSVAGRAGWLTSSSHVVLTNAPAQSAVLAVGTNVQKVKVDGATVPRLASVAALRAARTGWTYTRDPFLGVVVKLGPHGQTTHVDFSS